MRNRARRQVGSGADRHHWLSPSVELNLPLKESMATILCVDDDPAILELHGTLLRKKGYKVFTAPDGFSGIAITRQRHIDVVVLNINMPGMDGVQVAEVLKTERPTLPVVMWSGS
jgi:two-component system response regulator MprA